MGSLNQKIYYGRLICEINTVIDNYDSISLWILPFIFTNKSVYVYRHAVYLSWLWFRHALKNIHFKLLNRAFRRILLVVHMGIIERLQSHPFTEYILFIYPILMSLYSFAIPCSSYVYKPGYISVKLIPYFIVEVTFEWWLCVERCCHGNCIPVLCHQLNLFR